MKKNSSLEGHDLTTREWSIGDLVKINIHEWDATSFTKGLGIIVSVAAGPARKQVDLFPMIAVYNFTTSEVDKIYSYNLEIVSARQ